MHNYCFTQIRNTENHNKQGYQLICDGEPVETLLYNIDKISHKDLVYKKIAFFNFICSKYPETDRHILLMIFAYVDDDMLEYYKSQYPIKERTLHGWIQKGCPVRNERYYKKITEDEKIFIEVSLAKFRNRFSYRLPV